MTRASSILTALRLGWIFPVIRLCKWEEPGRQCETLARQLGIPLAAIAVFLLIWSQAVQSLPPTDLGKLPGPAEVWSAFGKLREEGRIEKMRGQHHEIRQIQLLLRNRKNGEPVAAALRQHAGLTPAQLEWLRETKIHPRFKPETFTEVFAGGGEGVLPVRAISPAFSELTEAFEGHASITVRQYGGRPTFGSQIRESLGTVFAGFLIASLIAIPVGILCGLSKNFHSAMNVFIQVFKPVSPLAWLPVVTLVVVSLHVPEENGLAISFVVSAIVVALCSLWPTLVNTALGVSSMDRDHLNIARVLNLGWFTRLFRIILPSSLPFVFTGLRISLGVGWMVLIAAEMLAQNPGLGKFVWDMFQNGSSETLAMIMVAVFTIGIIGFLLDTLMAALQSLVSYEDKLA